MEQDPYFRLWLCRGKWHFNNSAETPWENGCSKSLNRFVKRVIVLSVVDRILSNRELQTLFQIANLMNSCLIDIKLGSDISADSYLCPNNLIPGRSSNFVPSVTWDEPSNPRKALNIFKRFYYHFRKCGTDTKLLHL